VRTVLVCVLAALASRARAEDGAQPVADDRAVRPLIADAVAEYDAGRFEEARALFRRAHEQAPSARTLRGIGMASFELRDYVDAARALAAALREERRPLSPEQRAHVEGLLARAETFIGRFTLRLQPPDATLLVDARPASREADGTLLLPFGHHLLVARCPSCAPAERAIDVAGGERQELVLALAPLSAPPATQALAPRPVDRPEPRGGRGAAAYWLGGAALATAIGAGAAGFWWNDRAGELDRCRNHDATLTCQNESSLVTQTNVARGLTLGLAAAALTTGIVAAVIWARRDRAAATLACAGGKGAVLCAFLF
jgi:hypothetical protein